MNDLIEALTIFSKYTQDKYPTHCEHDELMIMVDPSIVSEKDIAKLEELGFSPDNLNEYFVSYRFGSR